MSVKPIPEGYTTITPYLIVEDADKLVEFVETIFGGQLVFKMKTDAGRISHGEMKVGNAMFMLSEASGEWKPTQTMLHLYVDDVDGTYKKAIAAGAVSVKEPQDQFYGDRSSCVQDSFGNFWGIATHIEDVSEEEINKRLSASAG
jgi:PhnB protein